jgi:hypothetical protein
VVSDNVLALVFSVLGLLFGSLLPGYLTYLALQFKESGFNFQFSMSVLKATVILAIVGFIVLLIIGVVQLALAIPVDHPVSSIALGFGIMGGFLAGVIALVIGIVRGKSSAKAAV